MTQAGLFSPTFLYSAVRPSALPDRALLGDPEGVTAGMKSLKEGFDFVNQ